MEYILCFLPLTIILITKIHEGGLGVNMNTEIIATLITVGVTLLITLIKGIFSINSMKKTLGDKIDNLNNDIGRKDNKTLTSQHNDISNCISKSFADVERRYQNIESRYDKEDEKYRAFSQKQIDIKETLDYFSRDYTELKYLLESSDVKINKLREKIAQLEAENKELRKILYGQAKENGLTFPEAEEGDDEQDWDLEL